MNAAYVTDKLELELRATNSAMSVITEHVNFVAAENYDSYRPTCFYMLVLGDVTRDNVISWIRTKLSRSHKRVAVLNEIIDNKYRTHVMVDMNSNVLMSTSPLITTIADYDYYLGKMKSPSRKKTLFDLFTSHLSPDAAYDDGDIKLERRDIKLSRLKLRIRTLKSELESTKLELQKVRLENAELEMEAAELSRKLLQVGYVTRRSSPIHYPIHY